MGFAFYRPLKRRVADLQANATCQYNSVDIAEISYVYSKPDVGGSRSGESPTNKCADALFLERVTD